MLRPTGLLAAKGLQQHYTPVEAATLAGRLMGAGACNVVDLTAGDGALMSAWPAECPRASNNAARCASKCVGHST